MWIKYISNVYITCKIESIHFDYNKKNIKISVETQLETWNETKNLIMRERNDLVFKQQFWL